MSLKVAFFQRVNRHGTLENCFLTIDGDGSTWGGKRAWVNFLNFENAEEASRPTAHPKQPFEMNVADRPQNPEFTLEAMKPTFSDPDLEDKSKEDLIAMMQQPRAFTRSDWNWEAAWNQKFIDDWTEIDTNGDRVEVRKSLSELNAQLIEV